MEKFRWIWLLLMVHSVELKFFGFAPDKMLKQLVAYDSSKIKNRHEELLHESVYYSPFQALAGSENLTTVIGDSAKSIKKRVADSKFRGKPKTIQEVWARNFNTSSQEFSQSTSLVSLVMKVVNKYLSSCVPVVFYDAYIEKSEGFILKRLFESFPTTFIHGRVDANFTVTNLQLLDPPDGKCRSYILFIPDALQTRQVLGAQIDNRVIVVPRSTQWKLQEFLSSPLSRDIINLLVIGESYAADTTQERPYVLYTHQLYVDGLGSNKAKVLTSWIKGRLSRPHINLFPEKLTKGFAGHRFAVSAADFPPFVFKILKTDGVGNVQIKWDGYDHRILTILGQRLNFTFDVVEPKNLFELGPGDAVGESIRKNQFDIGMAGMYVTIERSSGMEMSVAHGTDCAAFMTLSSKALPRYRAILGPFQWQVWVCLTFVYLIAIIPLAYSDSLSIRYLIEKPGQIENMFWYVFGTFTNSLTFSGEMTWSNSKKSSTRLLIGFYWVFTIIITACYTGSIIAFVTLPVYPDTVDSIEQLKNGFYRVGTLDRGGWERWFQNSTEDKSAKLLRNLEFVRSNEEGLGNVTKPWFLFPYAFIGSKAQLHYLIQTNYSDDKMLSRRSTLHVSNECFSLFGVAFAFPQQSVYRQKINNVMMMLQQNGVIEKIKNDVRWDRLRSKTGGFLQISTQKTLKITNQQERGLSLADTEGMFLLLGIGFLVAGGVLISEWVGGCTNKCMQFMRIKREKKEEDERVEEETRLEEEFARHCHEFALESASSVVGISFATGAGDVEKLTEEIHSNTPKGDEELETISTRSSRHSRSDSSAVADFNSATLTEMFHGPKDRPSNIIMINGKMMSEVDATHYANKTKAEEELQLRGSSGGESLVSEQFCFLKEAEDEDDEDVKQQENVQMKVCQVEINLQAPSSSENDIDDCFGEKIESGSFLVSMNASK